MSLAGVNLKMYMSLARTRAWLEAVTTIDTMVELFVLPSFVSLPEARHVLGPAGIGYGAQDVSTAESGAYTGEVSATALGELGCRYTAIGHAERRQRFGEDDATVVEKARALIRVGIVPVVCIGEIDRDEGVRRPREQMEEVLAGVPDECELVFAYEPVWAIGAADPPPAQHVVEMAERLRELYAVRPGRTRLIYGGSAGPGFYPLLANSVDGLFLGRFAHDISSLTKILWEMEPGHEKQPRTAA